MGVRLVCRRSFDDYAIDFGDTPGGNGQQQRGYENNKDGPAKRALSSLVFGNVVRHRTPWKEGWPAPAVKAARADETRDTLVAARTDEHVLPRLNLKRSQRFRPWRQS